MSGYSALWSNSSSASPNSGPKTSGVPVIMKTTSELSVSAIISFFRRSFLKQNVRVKVPSRYGRRDLHLLPESIAAEELSDELYALEIDDLPVNQSSHVSTTPSSAVFLPQFSNRDWTKVEFY